MWRRYRERRPAVFLVAVCMVVCLFLFPEFMVAVFMVVCLVRLFPNWWLPSSWWSVCVRVVRICVCMSRCVAGRRKAWWGNYCPLCLYLLARSPFCLSRCSEDGSHRCVCVLLCALACSGVHVPSINAADLLASQVAQLERDVAGLAGRLEEHLSHNARVMSEA